MKQVIDEYGKVILLVIVTSMCLVMFCNIWFGSGSIISNLATTVFGVSTSDSTITSTSDDGGMTIIKADGSTVSESSQLSADRLKEIENRAEPILYGMGVQNSDSQLLIGTTYKSNELFAIIDADDNFINKPVTSASDVSIDINDSSSGYFRILSISQGNGKELISNCSDLRTKSIAFVNETYSDKSGGAGLRSGVTSEMFDIMTPDGDNWFSYNVHTQEWLFYKAGTYCFRVFVCDYQGKSMTSTVYVSVAKSITSNNGSGTSAGPH